MIRSIYKIVPKQLRSKMPFVVLAILLRALLNFVGVAMLVPVLMIVVGGDLESNPYMGDIYHFMRLPAEVFVCVVCLMVVAVLVAKNLLSQLLYRSERNFVLSLYEHVSRQLYLGYFNQGLGFINRNNSAHLVRNVNGISSMFAMGLVGGITQIVGEVALVAIIFVVVLMLVPKAALVMVGVFVPITLAFYYYVRRALRDAGRRENELQRAKNRVVAESYQGYADVKVGGAMRLMANKFDSMMDEIVALRSRQASIAMLPQAFVEIGLVVGMAAMAIWGYSGKADMQLMFGIFAVLALRLLPVIRNIMAAWSSVRYNRYTIDVLREAKLDEREYDIEACAERMDMHESIELRGVSFKYDGAEDEIISNLSLRIKCGERVGIRGASGVGKTTLFNLILGLHRPTAGDVVIDGIKLDDSNIAKWQNSVGYVSQNVFLVDGTLAENIAFGVEQKDIDYNIVSEVVKHADLNEFVSSLSEGVHTPIGERGALLSGGQRQRIGIARALYKRCHLLLFDEATSSLDSRSEESVNEAIARLAADNPELTIVVIAHRESTLSYCERIITLD